MHITQKTTYDQLALYFCQRSNTPYMPLFSTHPIITTILAKVFHQKGTWIDNDMYYKLLH